jgi:hypothetical protein
MVHVPNTLRAAVLRLWEAITQVQIRRLPKPVVAAVAGYAVGGGNILQMMCDITVRRPSPVLPSGWYSRMAHMVQGRLDTAPAKRHALVDNFSALLWCTVLMVCDEQPA